MIATEPGKLTLVDKQNRGKLSEGRNYGIGFAFAKREGDVLSLVGPISPCKDYLNDQVYSEATGKPFYAHGYNASKTGCFEGGFGYLVMGIMPYNRGSNYSGQDGETAWMAANLPALESFVNAWEVLFKVEGRTEFVELEANRYVATIPLFWTEGTYLISLLTLLIRIAVEMKYKAGDVVAFIKDCGTGDSSHVSSIMPKIQVMLGGKIPKQTFTETSGWHDRGICGYNF